MFLGSKVRPVLGADNLTANYEAVVYTSDAQLAARGQDSARGFYLLQPPPSLRFILKNLNFTT
jgi:hypothetical protein